MQTLSLVQLERELKAAGAAQPVIARIKQEIQDHCQDAEEAAIARGLSTAEARREAVASLGSAETIAAAVANVPELLVWRQRWPKSAQCLDSFANVLAVPAAPFCYCATHPEPIVRWSLSSSLAVCVTASILLTMHWLILLSPV